MAQLSLESLIGILKRAYEHLYMVANRSKSKRELKRAHGLLNDAQLAVVAYVMSHADDLIDWERAHTFQKTIAVDIDMEVKP